MERWAALSAENSLKTDLAHRTAEMADIGGTTDVNGQPGMMLDADATGGNAVMHPEGFGYGPGDLDGTGAYLLPGMSSQASPLHDAGISGASMYGSSAVITSGGKSVAGQVTSTSATQVEKPKKKKNKVFGFLKDAADFLILDDVKTVFDPKASFLDKGLAIFSVTPAGKALKAGRLGFKLVRNSPVAKWVSPKKVDLNTKGTGKVSPYSHLEDSKNVGPGKDFTPVQKKNIIEENKNKNKNGGIVKSDDPNDIAGPDLVRPRKSQKGVTPPDNEWQIDHIVPKDKAGTNSYSNAQVLSRKQNRLKSNN